MTHIIWHRWSAWLETENTLSSFAKVVELGVDYIENDIWELADWNHIVFHDNLLDRVIRSSILYKPWWLLSNYPNKIKEKIILDAS